MPKYRFHLANGKSLVLEGDEMPTDDEVQAAADHAGVRSLLMRSSDETEPATASSSPVGPLTVAAAGVARRGAVYAGEQLATHPMVGRAVNAASSPAGRVAARAVGVTGGLPGYIASEAATSPMVTKAAEAAARGGGSLVARAAASPLARAATGLPGIVGLMPFTESGDRPLGETAQTTADRQRAFEAEAARLKAAEAERRRTGQLSMADMINDAVAMILGRSKK
jgi:hypothetical protein